MFFFSFPGTLSTYVSKTLPFPSGTQMDHECNRDCNHDCDRTNRGKFVVAFVVAIVVAFVVAIVVATLEIRALINGP